MKNTEYPFEVTWECTTTIRFKGTVWAENMNDCEALAENEWNDGHVTRDAYSGYTAEYVGGGGHKLQSISVKRELNRGGESVSSS